jgi:hypothetical protein
VAPRTCKHKALIKERLVLFMNTMRSNIKMIVCCVALFSSVVASYACNAYIQYISKLVDVCEATFCLYHTYSPALQNCATDTAYTNRTCSSATTQYNCWWRGYSCPNACVNGNCNCSSPTLEDGPVLLDPSPYHKTLNSCT